MKCMQFTKRQLIRIEFYPYTKYIQRICQTTICIFQHIMRVFNATRQHMWKSWIVSIYNNRIVSYQRSVLLTTPHLKTISYRHPKQRVQYGFSSLQSKSCKLCACYTSNNIHYICPWHSSQQFPSDMPTYCPFRPLMDPLIWQEHNAVISVRIWNILYGNGQGAKLSRWF